MKSLKINSMILKAGINSPENSSFLSGKKEYLNGPFFAEYGLYLIYYKDDTYVYFYQESDFDFSSGSKNINLQLLDKNKFLYIDQKPSVH